jgi:serine/threonine-protein kinase RsbW
VPATKTIRVTLETAWQTIDLAQLMTQRLAEALGYDETEVHHVAMSVREGIINALHYGNRMQRDKQIFLSYTFEPDRLVIRLLDQGGGFELADVADPLAEENLLKSSGRGLLLVRAFMDDVRVGQGAQGGAELVLVKRLPQTAATPGRD